MTSAILHVIDMTTFVDTIYYGPHTPGNGGPNSYAIKSGDICTAFDHGEKIRLIKDLRTVSGLGLKDAKDEIEAIYNHPSCSVQEKHTALLTVFQTYAYSSTVDPNLTISKTQLLSLLDGVIEHSSTFFMEPLDAIIMFCNNVKQKGGTPYLAAYYEKILKALE